MPNSPIVNRRVVFSNSSIYDKDAMLYINAVSDMPKNYKSVYNSFVIDLKTYGLWTKLKFGLLSPVTLIDSNVVIDIKTGTILSGAALKGTVDTGLKSTMSTPLFTGIYMKQTGDYVKTGAIPSALHSLNDTCIAHGILEDVTGANTFNYSAFQGSANSLQANLKTGSNQAIVDNYSNTASAGRNTFSSVTDMSGDWIINRRSSTDLEVYRNGVSVGTAANGGGGLPNVEVYLGAQNNAGSVANYKNHTCTYHIEFSGLTATERNNLVTCLNNYKTNIGNLGSLTRNLIWDGNSLSVYNNWNTLRAASYYSYSVSKALYRTRNFAIPGNTTAQRLTAYPSGAALEYNASYAKNIYVIWEIRNDIYSGASVATAQSNLSTLVSSAKATGYKVIVVCPHLTDYTGNTGRTQTQFNLDIDTMYSYCVANSFAADYVVQHSDTDLWVPRSSFASDAAYNTAIATKITGPKYTDGTHLTSTGYNSVGNEIYSQALSIIG